MDSRQKQRNLAQLDHIVEVKQQSTRHKRDSSSGEIYTTINFQDAYRIISSARAATERIAGARSPYVKQIEEILATKQTPETKVEFIMGVVEALRDDIKLDYLASYAELLHAELFSDFLDMSLHLNEEGYKDASAVITGSSLEAHLRQLCAKFNIAAETQDSSGIRPKKADQLNSELARHEIYSKLDQKSITAWLDLRNKAAHGKYTEYTKDQVSLMLAGVRDFITRNPA